MFVIDIPLDDCGLQGLGVTVYGRCSKKREDVGVYIKAIQPGGAAAKVSCDDITVHMRKQ